MKAIRVHRTGPPEVMQLEEVPDPIPGPGQALVSLEAAGVNPVDTYIRAAAHGRAPALPYTPGSDGAGVIEAIGPDLPGFAPGDRVYLSGTAFGPYAGTYAEKAVCGLANLHRLPAAVTFGQGAAVNVPYATAYRALVDRAAVRAGEILLVHGGSGGVGVAAIQLARAWGVVVFATAGTERGLKLVREQGAHEAFDHTQSGYIDRIREAAGSRGVDVIVEMLANVNLDQDLGLLAPRGRVVVIGNRGRTEIDARMTMARDSAILGMSLMNASPADLARIHSALEAALDSGIARPIVGQCFQLPDAAKAHEAVMAPGSYGKIVLLP